MYHDCSDYVKVPFYVEFTSAQKVEYCQLFYKANDKSIYCTYNQYKPSGLPLHCEDGGTCDSYTELPSTNETDRQIYCFSKINNTGLKCGYTFGFSSSCRDFDCQDIKNATSQIDCDEGAPGKKCVYLLSTCYNKDVLCTDISAQGGNERTYCDQVQAANQCTYISGTNCAMKTDCHLYYVTTHQAKLCATLTDVYDNKCTYLAGNNCVKLDACINYDGATVPEKGPEPDKEEEQCKAIKSIDNYPCIKESLRRCRAQVCTDNDSSFTDCMNNADGCLYYFNKCIAKDICANYTAQGEDETAKQAWCEGIQNTDGDFCVWDSTTYSCRNRSCSDKQFYTNFDCQNYLKTCKTNGTKCVSQYTPCYSSTGSSDFCKYLLDQTGKDNCRPIATSNNQSSNCTMKTCYDNVTATTDAECHSYLSGCVTRGTGCIPNTEPCSSYRGTKQQCELFNKYTGYDDKKKPTYEYCSGETSNIATSKCAARTCTDNTIATTDFECGSYMKGCITKGIGCVDATSSCTTFKGDQAACSQFLGSSGQDYCWNTSTALATSTCAKKRCFDITGKNNKECNDGMPPFKITDDPFCVFDGTQCTEYGKLCKAFNGTEETCPTFLAKDGPCKATKAGTVKGACAKRVCTDAPNTFTTDTDCQKYHKDCYTTGYGCTSINECKSKISKGLCQEKNECQWIKYCINSIKNCEAYNKTNYSLCANSRVNGNYCFWNEKDLICKSQTCENQPATLDSHSQCQNFAENCTTTGAGCITISECTAYTNKSICDAASSSKDGLQRCIWDSIFETCRNKTCNDIQAYINAECEAFNLDCKLNGLQCTPGHSCTEFTHQLYCIVSKKGPCLWVDGLCYDYSRCEDANKKSFIECQAFSPLCTTNGNTCVPITTCQNISIQISCVVGTDGTCGWLPTGICIKFGQCSDAISTRNDECLSYGPNCITNGYYCILKSTCRSYITQIACDNDGTDGKCNWNATTNICRLKECRDEQNSTNDYCKLISVAGGCTTDGTKCIPLSTCSSYVQAGCFNGTDGECIYALPVGATKGTKACRLKQCEDISDGTSNDYCMGVISGKSCVSNGKSCISKTTCSLYYTITACNGGGLENNKLIVCAFTPFKIDSTYGICTTFSQCSDAHQDQLACQSNPSCKWTENSTGTSCVNYTCATIPTETQCYPIPSFDGDSSTICTLNNGKCVPTDPITITSPKLCYIKSAFTPSWNILTSKCESCYSNEILPEEPGENMITINYILFLSVFLWGFLVSF